MTDLFDAADDAALDRALVKQNGLYEFIKLGWSTVSAGIPFVDNWHIGAMADHLQALYAAEINRLIINVPPASGKSNIASVFFPAWVWTQEADRARHIPGPGTRFHFLSYSAGLSIRDARYSAGLVDSEWYQQRWGGDEGVRLPKQYSVSEYKNNFGGERLTFTLEGQNVGRHAHIQIVDDPIKPKDTQGGADKTRAVMKKIEDIWSGTLASRVADPKYFARCIVMQRLHDADLCGTELSRGGYCHLMIPMRYEAKRAYSTGIGRWPKDPRTEDRELMWPARADEASVAQLEEDLGAFASAQLQQDPVPTTGGIFERECLTVFWSYPGEHYIPGTIPLPPLKEMSTCQSWDMAFKGKADSDRVAGGALGRHRAFYFLLDAVFERMTFTKTCDEVRLFSEKHPKIRRKLVEDKANGTAIVDTLQNDIAGFELVEPEGGKEARAWACSPIVKSKRFVLPHPNMPGFGWVKQVIEEMARFPKAPNDDIVDMVSQGLNWLSLHAPKWVTAMAARIEAEKSAQKPAAAELVTDAEPVQEAPRADVEGLKARLSAALKLNA